jgi:hypothetical protein
MAQCRKLTPAELVEWKNIRNLPANEVANAQYEFVNRIMGEEAETFPREDLGLDPEPSINQNVPNFSNRVPEVRPTFQDWEDELAQADQALASNPVIFKATWQPPALVTASLKARIRWGSANKEQRQANLKTAGMNKKLFVKDWKDLTPNEARKLILAEIPNHSLTMSAFTDVMDMEYYAQYLEEKTGYPFLAVLRRIEAKSSLAEITKDLDMREILTNPNFSKLRNSVEEKRKVALIINNRNDPKIVLDFVPTPEELEFADAISAAYKLDEPKVRYLRVMRAPATLKGFKETFPDAMKDINTEAQLEIAYDLRETGNLDSLWDFLYPLEWGVIGTGYDPRQIANSSLSSPNIGLATARGEGILLERESVEFPEDEMLNDVLQRLSTYKEQIGIQFLLQPELATWKKLWDEVSDKFELKSRSKMIGGMRSWIDRVQHIYIHYNAADELVKRTWTQAMRAVFWNPVLSLRNSMQAFMLHPDRIELAAVLFNRMSPSLRSRGLAYFESFVSNMGGLRKDYLHTKEAGWPGLSLLNKLAEKTSFYDYSDYFPRLHSFFASLNKANRATNAFLRDGNLDKWITNSGVLHLRLSERNYVMAHYLGQPTTKFRLSVNGLNEVSGAEMASYYVAQRITDITNFKMKRNTRGIMEMGLTGMTLWNLTVYPRGYAQRLFFQAEKIKNVFSKEATWEESRSGFNDIMKIVITAQLVGAVWVSVTGKNRNPWDTISTLFSWNLGGLFIGVGQEITTLISDIATAINPGSAEADRQVALAAIPALISRSASTLIPFYSIIVDIVDTALDKKNMDIRGMREVRAILDKFINAEDANYTPVTLDSMNRDNWDKVRKVLLAAESPDPDLFQKLQQDLVDSQNLLGTVDEKGRYYTLANFAGTVQSKLSTVPPALISEEEGFTPLTLFYWDSQDSWKEYYNLANDKAKEAWRKSHIEEEASLLFWGKYSKTVFTQSSAGGKEVKKLLEFWVAKYQITKTMQPGADWITK